MLHRIILDAIIGFLVALLDAVAAGASAVFVPVINVLAGAVETVAGLFVAGFSMGRLKRREKKNAQMADRLLQPIDQQ